jgi:hypothetical protein
MHAPFAEFRLDFALAFSLPCSFGRRPANQPRCGLWSGQGLGR